MKFKKALLIASLLPLMASATSMAPTPQNMAHGKFTEEVQRQIKEYKKGDPTRDIKIDTMSYDLASEVATLGKVVITGTKEGEKHLILIDEIKASQAPMGDDYDRTTIVIPEKGFFIAKGIHVDTTDFVANSKFNDAQARLMQDPSVMYEEKVKDTQNMEAMIDYIRGDDKFISAEVDFAYKKSPTNSMTTKANMTVENLGGMTFSADIGGVYSALQGQSLDNSNLMLMTMMGLSLDSMNLGVKSSNLQEMVHALMENKKWSKEQILAGLDRKIAAVTSDMILQDNDALKMKIQLDLLVNIKEAIRTNRQIALGFSVSNINMTTLMGVMGLQDEAAKLKYIKEAFDFKYTVMVVN